MYGGGSAGYGYRVWDSGGVRGDVVCFDGCYGVQGGVGGGGDEAGVLGGSVVRFERGGVMGWGMREMNIDGMA